MKDRKLRRLNKTELLWIIRDQEAEILELKAKLKELGWEEPDGNEKNKTEDEINDKSGSSDDRTDRT